MKNVRLTHRQTAATCTLKPRKRTLACSAKRGFSLFEVVVASLLVGTLLVAATRSLGASILTQRRMAERANAAWLADALLFEMHQQPYLEPGASSSAIVRETGESSSSRSVWDDFDDYHGLSESPPRNKDGTTMANLTGWQRSVTVQWVTLNNVATTSLVETGVKKATVTVTRNGATILTRVIIRTRGS